MQEKLSNNNSNLQPSKNCSLSSNQSVIMAPITRKNGGNVNNESEDDVSDKPEFMKLLNEVHKSQNYLSQQFDEFNQRTQLLEKENKTLKKEVTNLRLRLSAVESDCSELQNELYRKHLFISGVPQTQNESLSKIIIEIAAITNNNIDTKNIVECKRISTRNNNNNNVKQPQHPQIMVELDSVSIKENLLMSQKNNGPILQSQLQSSSNNNNNYNKIYINEFLSNYNKKLLHETQKLKAKHNIKFVWAKHGSVFLRQNETTKSLRIKNVDQLADLDKQLA